MADRSSSTEATQKRPSILDSFNESLEKSGAEGMQAIQEAAGEVQGEEANVKGGMEKPSEKIAERIGEKGEKRDFGSGGAITSDDDDQAVIITPTGKVVFPPKQIMVNKVVSVIRREIKTEMKKAAQLEKKLVTGNAKD